MQAFQTSSVLQTFTGGTSAPTSVQVKTADGIQGGQVILTNTSSTIDVVVGWGSTDAIAKLNAVAGNSSNQYYLLRGTQVVVSAGNESYFTGITGTSTAIVYVQAGQGN
jgi:hypothetical protein